MGHGSQLYKKLEDGSSTQYAHNTYTQHLPAVEAAPQLMQRLDRNSSNDAVGKPLVMISANCWKVGSVKHEYDQEPPVPEQNGYPTQYAWSGDDAPG